MVLYGSCARGDYTDDSDIDIALLVRNDRLEAEKYTAGLAEIATKMAMKYFAIVNFVCLAYDEFLEKMTWYGYFQNIVEEGEILASRYKSICESRHLVIASLDVAGVRPPKQAKVPAGK